MPAKRGALSPDRSLQQGRRASFDNKTFKFQPRHWFAWLKAREPDEHTQVLRDGIEEIRRSFEQKR